MVSNLTGSDEKNAVLICGINVFAVVAAVFVPLIAVGLYVVATVLALALPLVRLRRV